MLLWYGIPNQCPANIHICLLIRAYLVKTPRKKPNVWNKYQNRNTALECLCDQLAAIYYDVMCGDLLFELPNIAFD